MAMLPLENQEIIAFNVPHCGMTTKMSSAAYHSSLVAGVLPESAGDASVHVSCGSLAFAHQLAKLELQIGNCRCWMNPSNFYAKLY
jgi:hypothetical protein